MMSSFARLLLPALLMVSAGTNVRAQITGFFGDQGPFLDRADLVQADNAARRLLRPRPAAVGASESWAEPSSGDSGTLTVQRAYQSHGRDCRAVQWHDVFKSGADRSVLLQTCLVAGRWRLV